MDAALRFGFGFVVGVFLLKASIRLADGYNQKNTWGAACGWMALFSLLGFVPYLPFLVLGLVVYVMVLNRYYEIGPLRMVGVLAAQVVLTVGLGWALQATGLAERFS
ncbi:MAG: hypothetical protein D6731_04885 [Planctomycetota bacterium]|nr:MAG: hypothetical protein D6731_04885 [Planctomycetota bacterium]